MVGHSCVRLKKYIMELAENAESQITYALLPNRNDIYI